MSSRRNIVDFVIVVCCTVTAISVLYSVFRDKDEPARSELLSDLQVNHPLQQASAHHECPSPPPCPPPSPPCPPPPPPPAPETPASTKCEVKFLKYVSSPWELEWLKNVAVWDKDICSHTPASKVRHWVEGVNKIIKNPELINDRNALDSSVFSYFLHGVSCPGKPYEEVLSWIEPLAGLNRHPLGKCGYQDGEVMRETGATEYHMSCRFTMQDLGLIPHYGSKKRLVFDLGASFWEQKNIDTAGMTFLFYAYQDSIGIERFFGWEAKTYSPDEIFSQMPFEARLVMQYFPRPANIANRVENPLEYIRALAVPEDHIVVKLDIDTPVVEMQFLHEIINHPELVDEMYMEHHVDVPIMRPHWGDGIAEDLAATYRYFHKLRVSGVRMHSWP